MSDPINVYLTKKVITAVTSGRGLRGYGVEIDISEAGILQWRQLYPDAPWNDIIAMSSLKGDTGDPGADAHIHIKWHAEGSEVLLSTPDAYIGIYADNTVADSAVYADYQWFKYKGEKGDPAPNTIWQYSTDGTTWTNVATGAVYERQSGDGGTTWSEAHEYPGVAALNLKANTADVNAALALKADITLLNQEKLLLTQEIDSLKKSAIENSNAPYLIVSDYGAVALAKNSVGVGQFGVDGVTVENLITNGDFSVDSNADGKPDNWQGVGAVNSYDVSGNLVCTVPSPGYLYPRTYQNVSIVSGHKYYARARLKFSGINCMYMRINLADGSAEKAPFVSQSNPVVNQWYDFAGIQTLDVTKTLSFWLFFRQASTENSIGAYMTADKNTGIILFDLTAHGLDSLTVEQLNKLAPSFFNGKKTFGGIGCLVSKDSALAETGRMYFSTDPMYSNATLKDVLVYREGKYYHTHNVDSDGVAIAEPYDTEVDTNGQFLALSEGTVTYEPWYPDIGIYTDKFTLSKAITAVKELYKYGSATPITDAVIASDGLSFTSTSLTSGDLAYGVFEFDEPLRPLMTIKSRNDDATIADTTNGKIYTFRPVITNGAIASWTVTEV